MFFCTPYIGQYPITIISCSLIPWVNCLPLLLRLSFWLLNWEENSQPFNIQILLRNNELWRGMTISQVCHGKFLKMLLTRKFCQILKKSNALGSSLSIGVLSLFTMVLYVCNLKAHKCFILIGIASGGLLLFLFFSCLELLLGPWDLHVCIVSAYVLFVDNTFLFNWLKIKIIGNLRMVKLFFKCSSRNLLLFFTNLKGIFLHRTWVEWSWMWVLVR